MCVKCVFASCEWMLYNIKTSTKNILSEFHINLFNPIALVTEYNCCKIDFHKFRFFLHNHKSSRNAESGLIKPVKKNSRHSKTFQSNHLVTTWWPFGDHLVTTWWPVGEPENTCRSNSRSYVLVIFCIFPLDSNWDSIISISNSFCENSSNHLLDTITFFTVDMSLVYACKVALLVQLPGLTKHPWPRSKWGKSRRSF